MTVVNVYDAKAHFSRLLDRADDVIGLWDADDPASR